MWNDDQIIFPISTDAMNTYLSIATVYHFICQPTYKSYMYLPIVSAGRIVRQSVCLSACQSAYPLSVCLYIYRPLLVYYLYFSLGLLSHLSTCLLSCPSACLFKWLLVSLTMGGLKGVQTSISVVCLLVSPYMSVNIFVWLLLFLCLIFMQVWYIGSCLELFWQNDLTSVVYLTQTRKMPTSFSFIQTVSRSSISAFRWRHVTISVTMATTKVRMLMIDVRMRTTRRPRQPKHTKSLGLRAQRNLTRQTSIFDEPIICEVNWVRYIVSCTFCLSRRRRCVPINISAWQLLSDAIDDVN